MSVAPRTRLIRLVEFYRGNCSKTTAISWINEGRLKAYKLGRMTFVDQSYDEFVRCNASPYVIKPGRGRPRLEDAAPAAMAAAPPAE